jgi:hypothetical protein
MSQKKIALKKAENTAAPLSQSIGLAGPLSRCRAKSVALAAGFALSIGASEDASAMWGAAKALCPSPETVDKYLFEASALAALGTAAALPMVYKNKKVWIPIMSTVAALDIATWRASHFSQKPLIKGAIFCITEMLALLGGVLVKKTGLIDSASVYVGGITSATLLYGKIMKGSISSWGFCVCATCICILEKEQYTIAAGIGTFAGTYLLSRTFAGNYLGAYWCALASALAGLAASWGAKKIQEKPEGVAAN